MALSAAFMGRPTIAAASTHPGEEEVIVEVHARLKQKFPNLVTIIAPRHPDRGPKVAAIAAHRGLAAVLRTSGTSPGKATDIYVCDTVGELGIIYRIAPVVFMGGSLVAHGGQNPIEAIKLGAAVLHGPFISNFAEVYAALDGTRGADLIADATQLATRAASWLSNSDERLRVVAAGKKTVESLSGALERNTCCARPLSRADPSRKSQQCVNRLSGATTVCCRGYCPLWLRSTARLQTCAWISPVAAPACRCCASAT